jgi:hypothetical protein
MTDEQFHFDPVTYLAMIREEVPDYDMLQGEITRAVREWPGTDAPRVHGRRRAGSVARGERRGRRLSEPASRNHRFGGLATPVRRSRQSMRRISAR